MGAIIIDKSKCTNCMLCSKVCFLNYQNGDDNKPHTLEQPMMCAACGHCVAVCPTQAISHPSLDTRGFEPIDESKRPSYEQFTSFLKMRRSRREFKDEQVSRKIINKLLSAAAQAPNGLNRHNVRYTVITNRSVLKELSNKVTESTAKLCRLLSKPVARFVFKTFFRNLYGELEFFLPIMDQIGSIQNSGLDLVLYNAPCAILIHTPKHDMCGSEDSVYSGANILLAAETLGLGACVIGFITSPVNSDKRLKKLLGIPQDHKVHTSIILGYPEFGYQRTVPKAEPEVEYIEEK